MSLLQLPGEGCSFDEMLPRLLLRMCKDALRHTPEEVPQVQRCFRSQWLPPHLHRLDLQSPSKSSWEGEVNEKSCSKDTAWSERRLCTCVPGAGGEVEWRLQPGTDSGVFFYVSDGIHLLSSSRMREEQQDCSGRLSQRTSSGVCRCVMNERNNLIHVHTKSEDAVIKQHSSHCTEKLHNVSVSVQIVRPRCFSPCSKCFTVSKQVWLFWHQRSTVLFVFVVSTSHFIVQL